MKVFRYMLITVMFFILAVSANGASLTADEILRKMDEHHLISDNFEMMIRVERYVSNQFEGSTVMKGYINNGKMSMLTFLEPPNMRDRKIVIKENDMWLIIPKVKNPIRITASQRLMGGISYGDIVGVNFTEGYIPKLNGGEEIVGMNSDGSKSDTIRCFVLELTAKDMKPSYNKIIIWVDQQNLLPVKADFFTLSGKKMTTVYYTSPKEWEGKIIITKMFLFDQINTTKHFSMEYSDIKATQITGSFENSLK